MLLLLCWFLPANAQKKPFSLDAVYRVKGVSSPVLSPEGNFFLYTVTSYTLKTGKAKPEIYLYDIGKQSAEKVDLGSLRASSPFWGANEKGFFFLASQQVFFYSFATKLSSRMTNFPLGVNTAAVSPDGKLIAFSSDVYPECGADTACNKKNEDGADNGPIQAYMADKLLFRHWTEYSAGKVSHIFLQSLEDNSLIDITPVPYNCPAFSLGGSEFKFSPDSRYICYSANPDENLGNSTNCDLWLYDIQAKTTANITRANLSWDGGAEFSPDSKYIAYRFQKIPNYESDRFRIGLYTIADKKTEVLTESFDNWIVSVQWAPKGDKLYFTAEVGGYTPLYALTLGSGKIDKVSENRSINGVEISRDGKTAYYDCRLIDRPADIYALNLETKAETRLTTHNKAVTDDVDFRPADQLWITGAEGKKVHVFLVKPHDFDPAKKYPLVVNVHGGPQSQWMDAYRPDAQLYSGYGYIIALPNPHGSTGYGQDYTAAISGDWGGKVFEDVMAVTDSLAKLPYVDTARIGAMGWSYGGYMMNWLQGHTKRFKCLVSMMGLYDVTSFYGTTEELWFPEWDMKGTPWENPSLYEKFSPSSYVNNFATPTLIITGERDYRVSYTQSLEYFTALQKKHIDSKIIVFKNDGHWPSFIKSMPLYFNAHLEWFHKYLGGADAPYDSRKLLINRAFED